MELPDDNSRVTPTPADSDPDPTSVSVIEFLSGRHRGAHEEIIEPTVFLALNEIGGLSIIPASKAVEGEDIQRTHTQSERVPRQVLLGKFCG